MENNIPISPEHDTQSVSGHSSKRRAVKIAVAIVAAAIVIAAIFYARSVFVAATVDGTPITRLSVIRQLEKQGGKNVLDALIAEYLIEHEAAQKGITVSEDDINQEVQKISASVVAQGGTLEAALAQKGLTQDDLHKNIRVQKMIEKLLADKLQITQQEIDKFIADNKVAIPKGQEAQMNAQVVSQLRNQKLNQEAGILIGALKAKASITQYVNY